MTQTFRAAACLPLFLAAPALAHETLLIHAGQASGTLDGAAFGPVSFVIRGFTDFDERQSFPGGYFLDHHKATITLVGMGSLEFLVPTRSFVNNTVKIVGFSDAATGFDLFDGPSDLAFASWDMTSPLMPVSGDGQILAMWTLLEINTSAGRLVLDADFDTRATFEAIVPAPNACALAVAWAAGATRRRRA